MKRKLLGVLTAFASLLCIALCFTGCALVNPGKMSKLKGTYQLTRYERNFSGDDGESSDLIADRNITCYLVIDGTQYAYVVYRDSEQPLVCRKVSIRYTYEQDADGKPTDKISTIEYHAEGDGGQWFSEYARLGFYSRRQELNYTLPHTVWQNKTLKTDYTDHMLMKKVNKATDLSFAEKKLGVTLTVED